MRNAEAKAQKEKRTPVGTYKKQQRFTILFAVLIVLLAVAAAVAYYFVHLSETSFEHNGITYRVVEKDGVYVLTDGDGITCEKAYGGQYYMTNDGEMLIYVDSETGSYSVYAAVEGLEYDANDENSENAYYVSTNTVLVFPVISESNMQAVTMHNENGTFTFYRDESDTFRLLGMENYLMTYSTEAFSTFLYCTGTMIAQDKIVNPLTDENGEYSEYGLADSDTYYTVTTLEDKVYKVIIGDKTPSGDGYYVQYVECTDPVLNADGTVASMTETPRRAVYITANETMNTSTEYVEKPFHTRAEDLMVPQIVYEVTLSDYFDVQNYILMKNDVPFVAFDYIDIAERSISERATTPFVMLLDAHSGFAPNSNNILDALESFYGMTFFSCTKLDPSVEDLVAYGVYTNPVHAFTEKSADGKSVHYLVLEKDGEYVLCDSDKNPLVGNADGTYTTEAGAVLRVDAENGTGETLSGEGSWDVSYSSPYSIYYNFDVTSGGVTGTTEQLVFFSNVTTNNSVYAYSPNYGMLVEVAAYDLEFLLWDLFEWVDTDLFDVNIAYVSSLKVEDASGLLHGFTLDNSGTKQGSIQPLEGKEYYLSKQSGSYVYYTADTFKQSGLSTSDAYAYLLKKVDGAYGVYNTKGKEYTVAVEAYFRIDDPEADQSNVYFARFGMPSGGASEGWFKGKVYLTPDNYYILVGTENGYWGVMNYSVSSSSLTVRYDATGMLVDTDAFRNYFQVLSYASIEQQHVLTEEEEAALIGNPANFQLRLTVKTEEQEFVYEFYYLTSRKSYLRLSGDGGKTFTGNMYVLTARVEKLLKDAEKVLTGDAIDSTAKN